ncbi:hypothetical protein EVAR_38424_1 [Eumeta japonica]|uniref:Uncharacterized protein n=1 Tax=Eumeta variegata TaxID=151549 RepID=A0A4C1X0I5_EUMVA|nr:hypothetical protein EVAR_38424_1 [Eumeta japonica]
MGGAEIVRSRCTDQSMFEWASILSYRRFNISSLCLTLTDITDVRVICQDRPCVTITCLANSRSGETNRQTTRRADEVGTVTSDVT